MSYSTATTGRESRIHWLFATIGTLCGLFLTQFVPMVGLALGIAAAIAAVVLFLVKKMPRWTAWLMAGLAIGVTIYYVLALFWILNPTPGSGSGSGGPT